MDAPRESPHVRDRHLRWWLGPHVGWVLAVGIVAISYDTAWRIASVHIGGTEAEPSNAENTVYVEPISTTVSGLSSVSPPSWRTSPPPADRHADRMTYVGTARSGDSDHRERRTQRGSSETGRSGRLTHQDGIAHPAGLQPTYRAENGTPGTLRRAKRADRQLAALVRSLSAPSGWVSPLTSPYRITATFGAHGSMWSSTHTGVDLAAPTGTPVRSVAAGTVTFAGDNGAYGLKVVVQHDDGSETWYAHLSDASVTPGQTVQQGSPIGEVGATGNVTGPHLHLEFRPSGGEPVDPVHALRIRGATL